jgi:hypothetical protein
MPSNDASRAGEVRKKAFITAIHRRSRHTFTTANAVGALMSDSKISSASTAHHFVQISRTMKLFPDDVGSLL